MAGPLASAQAALVASLVAALSWAAPCIAAEAPTASAGLASTGLHASVEAAPPAAIETPQALPLEDLQTATAGAAGDTNVFSNQQVTAANSGNSITADTMTSGEINFSGSALSGFNGVGNFVFNTGSNNNLQGVVSVNVVSVPGL